MDALKRRRQITINQLNRLHTYSISLQGEDAFVRITKVKSNLAELEALWNQFKEIQDEIELTCPLDELNQESQERDQFNEMYHEIHATFNDVLEKDNNSRSSDSGSEAASYATARLEAKPTIKLPKLDLPTFSGNYTEWTSFHDLFTAVIHNNATLSGAVKLQYLKGSLKGEAQRVIQNITVSDANYEEAWKILKERYENKRLIVTNQLRTLLGQPSLKQESATDLRKLLDKTTETVRALKVLDQFSVDTLLIHFLTENLDSETRRLWELSLKDDFPTYEEFSKFMETRHRSLEASLGEKFQKLSIRKESKPFTPTSTNKVVHFGSSNATCSVCKEGHFTYKCPKFNNSNLQERQDLVRQLRLCYNCLQANHNSRDCQSSSCRKCGKKHHTLLHDESKGSSGQTPVKTSASSSASAPVATHVSNNNHIQVLLATAMVKVQDGFGNEQLCRALLDGGAQVSFMTEACAQRLHLKKKKAVTTISGICNTSNGTTRGMVNIKLSSTSQEYSVNLDALILREITGQLPSSFVPLDHWKHLNGIKLADPHFNKPGQIDILIGGDIFYDLIESGRIQGPSGTAPLRQTVLGWVVAGKIDFSRKQTIRSHLASVDLDAQLKAFWEVEELQDKPLLSKEEQDCENHFVRTHKRDSTGRYEVELPFKEVKTLGNSRQAAVSRLQQVERKLARDPKRQQQYNDFMDEYQSLGHMELIPKNQVDVQDNYYMPHHAVIRDSSSTTKLRVVFDASAKTSNGFSLNDTLMVGPTVQQELFNIVLRFRLHQVALIADIEKMFRQVNMQRQHWDYQRIVWRKKPTEEIQDFRLKTVTYGTAAGPYLATKALQQLAIDEKPNHPNASRVALKDFYVDDLMSGTKDKDSALALQKEIISLINTGGMKIRKWMSNDPDLMASVAPEDRGSQQPFSIDIGESTKALGLNWYPAADHFKFTVSQSPHGDKFTKRTILSDIARLFDPLGWLSPVIVKAKIFMQSLWLLELSWDEEVPDHVKEEWLTYSSQLKHIENIKIPRCISVAGSEVRYELYGFCDASEQAYAAVIYLASTSEEEGLSVDLVCSKTKVAPLKTVSIPRLELCGAVLCSRLLRKVELALDVKIDDICAWTDSKTVLCWIAKPPRTWKTFVANRVSEIQDLVTPEHWYHVPTKGNPADLASRGVPPEVLEKSCLWWHASDFSLPHFVKTRKHDDDPEALKEKRTPKVTTLLVAADMDLTGKYSTLNKLLRVTAYVLRFLKNSRLPKDTRTTSHLNAKELDHALMHWIKLTQQQAFSKDLELLKHKKPLKAKSRILSFSPFLDENGLIRVGGRIKKAEISVDQKNPILLPKSNLSKLLIRDEHKNNAHACTQLLMSILRQRYWIIGCKSTVREEIHKCIICFKQRKAIGQQMMGDLPRHRLEPARPFLRTGLDYGGPFTIKMSKCRGGKTMKAYICLFVCMATKAIHLELVSDLSSESFIAALKRFVSRRGYCTDIYSDNGTNFVGANKELDQLLKIVRQHETSEDVAAFSSSKGINWHFVPPSAPHFGGLWEAGIKSTKQHLYKIIGNTILTFEEFSTVLAQIEACLNSRPLCPLSEDPNDLQVLTPGHFIIGEPLTAVPEPDLTPLNTNRLSRWQHTQQLVQHFWRRWTSEYLTQLQQRPKWKLSTPNMKVGDLVLIKEEASPLNWKLARVIDLHPGTDGCVRVVTLKTQHGILKRPIAKLCLLPSESAD